MPHQVVWTQAALDELSEILIEEDTPDGSNQLEDTAFFQAGQLENQPLLGPVFALLGKPYRHLVIHPNYRLIYVPRKGQVFILAFLHTRRKFTRAWKERRRPVESPPPKPQGEA